MRDRFTSHETGKNWAKQYKFGFGGTGGVVFFPFYLLPLAAIIPGMPRSALPINEGIRLVIKSRTIAADALFIIHRH